MMSCGRLSIRVQQRSPFEGRAFGTEFKQLYFMGPHCFPLLEHWAEAVQLDGKRYDDHQRQGHSDQNDSD